VGRAEFLSTLYFKYDDADAELHADSDGLTLQQTIH
jgi:hypothetical protein